jgi:SET domain-containing protein
MLAHLATRPSPRHGLGVFATAPIRAHALVIEYTGELIAHDEAARRYPHAGTAERPEHTYVLQLDETRVIDANVGGNTARLINHSCAPNLEPVAIGDHLWLVARRDIAAGEELGYDYAIELDERHTPAAKRRYPCCCGAPSCRGTLLRPKHAAMDAEARAVHKAVAAQLRVLAEDAAD